MDDGIFHLTRHKLDVDAYRKTYEAGVFGEAARVELIDGEILDMAPIGSDHSATVDGLTEAMVLACHGRAIVRIQSPVLLDRLNEPEPDVAVLRLREDRYRSGHPGAGDILLLVEVADSSLRFDQAVKLPLYARTGVPEVWIVDLVRRALDAYREPVDGAYRLRQSYAPGERIALAAAPEISLVLDGVFG